MKRINLKNLLLTFLILPNLAFAIKNEMINDNETASPFPNAKKGITIVPLMSINVPIEVKNKILKNKESLKIKGYEETTDTDDDVNALFALAKNAKEEIAKFDNDPNLYDTHLKSSASKIKLAFIFNGIPDVNRENVIGYAAIGGYKKDKGWDGVVEFINYPKIGICSYSTYEIERVILDKETTEYLVNDKPSNKSIAGNWKTGFLYKINWYTSSRLMSLECANKLYDPNVIKNMLTLANKIDEATK